MKLELDCRGMSCPAPVLHVRDSLGQSESSTITVLVDNEAARQNVGRFLEHQKYSVKSEACEDGIRVFGTQGGIAVPPVAVSSVSEIIEQQVRQKKIMVLVTSDHMGHGDDSLGDMLMFNFIKTLKEMRPNLWRIVFVNSGVSFTAEGSETVPLLQELAVSGVQIMACGACLAFFNLLDKIQVGDITNMLDIVSSMKLADSVVTI